MKKLFAKILSLVLAATFVLQGIPVPVFAADAAAAGTVYEVVTDNAVLRTEASKHADVVTYLPRNSFLTVTGTKVNAAGNTWYVSEAGFIHEDHLAPHSCSFEELEENFFVCKCGSYKIAPSGMQVTSATAVAGTLLGADVMAGAAALGGFATTASAAASAAFPYVAVVVVGGMIVYMLINSTGTQIADIEKVTLSTKEEVEIFNLDDDPDEPYHKAATLQNTGGILVLKDGMTISEANKFLKNVSNDFLYGTLKSLTEKTYINVWCFSEKAAYDLAERFEKNGPFYTYGDSSGSLSCEVHNDVYDSYEHLHLFARRYTSGSFSKVCDAHIFYGVPVKAVAAAA